MIPFLLYIIKLSCCLTLFYAGYKILLSKETFFHFNRIILLTGILACLLFPMIKIRTATTGIVQQPMVRLEKIMKDDAQLRTLPATHLFANDETSSDGKRRPSFSFVRLFALIFTVGSMVHVCLLARSHISLSLLIRKGRKIKHEDFTVVLLDSAITPFNYGRYIIISEYDYQTYQDTILTHEIAHFRFSHTFDIVLIELLTLLQWFNPVVRLLKKEVRKVHEFQADSEVLKSGVDMMKYQLLLLKKTAGSGSYLFANNLNHNKLKIRFNMMLKKKSNSWARCKLLLLLPVAALIMYAFACSDSPEQKVQKEVDPVHISFIDNTGKIVRSFELEVGDSLASNNGSINTLKEWLSSLKKEDMRLYTVSIKASPGTPMSAINDIKDILRSQNALKVSYSLPKTMSGGRRN